MAKVVETCRGK